MPERVKIFFPIVPASEDGITGEWLWTKPLGGGRFEIDNSPFDLYGVSAADIVAADEIKGVMTFKTVVYRGGHSTYRIRLGRSQTREDFLRLWPVFEALGCSYEGTSSEQRVYSIDVPPEADVSKVYALLEAGENASNFEFEEAHYCRPGDRN
jgi:hypothetical protein